MQLLLQKVPVFKEAQFKGTFMTESNAINDTNNEERPSVGRRLRAQAAALCSQGYSLEDISRKTGLDNATVQEIVNAACKESETAYMYMNREEPCTLIKITGLIQKVEIMNFTDDLLSRAFGVKEHPDWEDFEEFLELRCMPRTRFGIREELRELGVDSYDPLLIIEKTKGRLYDDSQWLEKLDAVLLEQCEAVIAQEGDPALRNCRLGRLICEAAREEEQNQTQQGMSVTEEKNPAV